MLRTVCIVNYSKYVIISLGYSIFLLGGISLNDRHEDLLKPDIELNMREVDPDHEDALNPRGNLVCVILIVLILITVATIAVYLL